MNDSNLKAITSASMILSPKGSNSTSPNKLEQMQSIIKSPKGSMMKLSMSTLSPVKQGDRS